jgi:carbamoyltransferase
MRTNIDALVLGPYLLYKREQPAWKEGEGWRTQYQLD